MALRGEPTLTATLVVQRGDVACAATCGALLAAGGGDGALRLWRWRSGTGWLAVGETRAHRYGVTAVQFAHSGVLLATAGVDGAARVWAARGTLQTRRVLAAPGVAAARAVRWATGERLCVGHDDGALRVWAVRTGVLLAHVRAHEGALHAVVALAGAALLLTACTEGVLKVYDFEGEYFSILLQLSSAGAEGGTGPAPLLWEDGAHDLGALCGAGWARGAATGGHDARVRVWRVLGAGRARRVAAAGTLSGHTAAVTALSWARGVLASASLDRTARLWTPDSGACLCVLHAHARYLTCIALVDDLRYIVTGSNDRSIRTWSLGSFSLDDDLDPTCMPLDHFGLGDLEGIGPVDDEAAAGGAESTPGTVLEPQRVHRVLHPAAVNCVVASGDRLATACFSDGRVRVFGWQTADGMLVLQHELLAHAYPALAVDFDASGTVLLSGGLDGCARLWDVESGCALAALSVAGLGAPDGGGGGGVRGARCSPLLLLLASDDGVAAVWGVDPVTPDPLHVYPALSAAATCCAWARGARACACGGAAGELLLLAAPPRPAVLASCTDAHDLGELHSNNTRIQNYGAGVLSCDFNPSVEKRDEDEGSESYLLATGGQDALVKLWWAVVDDNDGQLTEAHSLAAHEGAVQCVRWSSAGDVLATGGNDRWARVWSVEVNKDQLEVRALFAVPTDVGGALAVCLFGDSVAPFLTVGSQSGSLTLWQLPTDTELDRTEGAEPRVWGTAGVTRWLREYVTRPPGTFISEAEETRLLDSARSAALSGAELLDTPLQELLQVFTYGSEDEETIKADGKDAILERLRDEILWLRRDALPDELESAAPHALRCPLSHRVMREPARAADGFTYDRQSFLHWRLASGSEELVSPVTARRLLSAAVAPNYGVRDALRHFLSWPLLQPQPTSDQHCDQ
ncbi:WD repeat, SAM and U-box domain-containing protein 1-like [Maniola jurtina]|uniref:WD repeat, SAM and U-box domain-containing protein 1-like n=1 Tax=Maniola jurtina TaxID=191418 RepID=UPI001E68A96E|nr:WD repeat, SAM and U-box domain-containing protein 1-like [Maniola jurtina]